MENSAKNGIFWGFVVTIVGGLVVLLVEHYIIAPDRPITAEKVIEPSERAANSRPESASPFKPDETKRQERNANLHIEYLQQGNTLFSRNEYNEAIRQYKLAIAAKPDFAEAFLNIGAVYQRLKNYDEAIYHYRRAVELRSDYPEAYNGIGRVYNNMRNFDKAIENFKKAITLNPEYYQAHHALGSVYFNQRNYEQAAYHYRRAVEINPRYAIAYIDLGDAYWNLKNWDAATNAYKQYVKFDPNRKDVIERLRQAEKRKGE